MIFNNRHAIKKNLRNKKDGKFKKILVIFFISTVGTLGFILATRIISLEKINFSSGEVSCVDNNILKTRLNTQGENFFSFNKNLAEGKIKKEFLCIDSVEFKFTLPQTLNVNLVARKPAIILNIFNVATDSSKFSYQNISLASQSAQLNIPTEKLEQTEKLIADEKGFIFSVNADGLINPQVDYLGRNLKVGEYSSDAILNSIFLIKNLPNKDLKIQKLIILNEKALIVKTRPDIVFSLKKDPKKQLASLQLILQKNKMNSDFLLVDKKSQMIQSIDLRFDKPVLNYDFLNKREVGTFGER